MYVSDAGPTSADPVVLLHGGGVAGWMWDAVRARLETTYRVIVPDLPGHGRSADEPYISHTHTLELLRSSLSAAVQDRPLSIIGFSLGAQLAIRAASEWPGLVERVAVISAQAKPLPFPAMTLQALKLTAPLARQRWFAKLQAKELFIPSRLMEDYISTSAAITAPTLLAAVRDNIAFQVPAGWASFPGQALVMVGEKERRLMRDSASTIHTALPTSELEIVRDCGHGIPLQQPEWFAERMIEWMADGRRRR
ncbi:alpha/beta fold hydrolase [Herbiconiux liukaitaii]|uniref:alpha/beta fold hydrolase n=1 Tax=Herbiconiux liukaitaii TaxID=3342799 RepID=UPI0035BB24E2